MELSDDEDFYVDLALYTVFGFEALTFLIMTGFAIQLCRQSIKHPDTV